jgi:hypothetical protein
MSLDSIFSGAGLLAVCGWLALVLAPVQPAWAQLVAARLAPALIALVYAALIARFWSEGQGGFGSLEEVSELFNHRGLLLAGWLHYLAFDLFVGAWEVREAERIGLAHLAVLPALVLTFLFGPIGLLLFLAMRAVRLRGSLSRLQGEAA